MKKQSIKYKIWKNTNSNVRDFDLVLALLSSNLHKADDAVWKTAWKKSFIQIIFGNYTHCGKLRNMDIVSDSARALINDGLVNPGSYTSFWKIVTYWKLNFGWFWLQCGMREDNRSLRRGAQSRSSSQSLAPPIRSCPQENWNENCVC